MTESPSRSQQESESTPDRLQFFSLLTGGYFILFIFLNLSVISIAFAFSQSLPVWSVPFAGLAAFLPLMFLVRKYYPERGVKSLAPIGAAVLGIFTLSMLAAGYYYDVSYDGRLYHQSSVIHLATGWNPFSDPQTPNGRHPGYEPLRRSIWSVVYPRSPETNGASLYALTGKIEHGKAFNVLLVFASFFLALAALLSFRQLNRKIALLVALLAALNPVAVCTVFSYYVDGQLASLLTCLFALGALMLRKPETPSWWFFFPALALLADTKFTGLAYAVVIAFGVSVGWIIRRSPRRFLATASACLAAGIIGFALFGYSPYITNWRHYGHPLHPIAGKDKMKGLNLRKFLAVPKNLRDKNPLEKFAISMLSRSEFVTYPDSAKLKIPFSVSIDEIRQFSGTHVRAGGFGPLFGGVFFCVIPLFGYAAFRLRGGAWVFGVYGLLIFGSALINWEFWWARLAPQIALIPLVLLLYIFVQPEARKNLKGVAFLLLALLTANLLMISASYFYHQTAQSMELKSELEFIRRDGDPIEVDMTEFKSARVMLMEAGIAWKETDNLKNVPDARPLGHGVWYRFMRGSKKSAE